jgi:hypothetical protein
LSFFAALRRSRISAIIPDTAPFVDEAGADCTQARFPPSFRSDAMLGGALEPLAADARKGKDGFRNAWLKVIAGLSGVSPGQIVDRDRRRQRGRALLASAAALVFCSAVVFGFIKFREAEAYQLEANRSREVARRGNERVVSLKRGMLDQAIIETYDGDSALSERQTLGLALLSLRIDSINQINGHRYREDSSLAESVVRSYLADGVRPPLPDTSSELGEAPLVAFGRRADLSAEQRDALILEACSKFGTRFAQVTFLDLTVNDMSLRTLVGPLGDELICPASFEALENRWYGCV